MMYKSNEIPPRKSSPNIIRPSTEVYALQFLFFKCHKLPALYPPLIHGNRQNIKTEERRKIYILTHRPNPICSINQDGLGSFIVNTKYGVWSSVSLGVSRASRNYIPCHASNELTEKISVSEFNVLFRFWRKMMCGRCFDIFFMDFALPLSCLQRMWDLVDFRFQVKLFENEGISDGEMGKKYNFVLWNLYFVEISAEKNRFFRTTLQIKSSQNQTNSWRRYSWRIPQTRVSTDTTRNMFTISHHRSNRRTISKRANHSRS